MSKLNEKLIIDLYNQGKTQKEIATQFGTYNTSIRRVLLRNNIKIRSNSEITRFVKNNPFKNQEYWLGLLAADGCVTGVNIVLQLKDVDHLEKYVEFINSPQLKVNKYWNKTYCFFEYYVKFKNKEVKEYLHSIGITERKSMTFEYKNQMNWDFIRGYIDGDGSIGVYKKQTRVSITSGSLIILNQIKKFMNAYNINPFISKRKDGIYNLVLHRQHEIYNLYTYMYNNANYFLTRKKNKFGHLLEKFKSS